MFQSSLRPALWALALSGGIAGASHAGDLDGTNWKMKPSGWRSAVFFWVYDHLNFKAGEFTSVDCVEYGFKTGPYASAKAADGVTWKAVQKNDKGETMSWEGTLRGEEMTGSFIWTKANGKTKTIAWHAKKVTHEHPVGHEHPTEKKKTAEKEHPAGKEHPTQNKQAAEKEHPAGKEHPTGKEHPAGN